MKRQLQLLIALSFILLSLLILPSCGDAEETPYTWGDVSVELATAFCAALDRCGSTVDQPICIEHTRFHLCEPDHNCDTAMEDPTAAAEASGICADALDAVASDADDGSFCFFLQAYGVAPPECSAVLELRPDPSPAP